MKKVLKLFLFVLLCVMCSMVSAGTLAINSSRVFATSVKFTATLNAPLTAGNKVKIDYGKGLVAMKCSVKTCTLSSNSQPNNTSSIVYKIGIYNAQNKLESALQTGTYTLSNLKTTLDIDTETSISSFQVDATAFKFITTLSNPLIAGYKVKLDYGKGLSVMSCSAKTCSLSTNINTPLATVSYKVGIYNTQNQLQGASFNSDFILSSTTKNAQNSTVVIRIVGTDSDWGQEDFPAWAGASPVKSDVGYQLYDLEIGRYTPPKEIAKSFQSDGHGAEIASPVPKYVALYKFANGSLDKATSTIRSIPVEAIANSTQTARALKTLVDLVLTKENPTRIVIEYSGHGSPWSMFEGAITLDEGAELFDAIRIKKSGIPLILDFSTNCSVGYFDFAVHYFNHADYLLASDKAVGGFAPNIQSWNPGTPEEAAFMAADHDHNYDKFFKASNSLEQAFDEIIAARKKRWLQGSNSIKDGGVEQSLSIYKLNEFENLMIALKNNGFNPMLDLSSNSDDLATYIYNVKNEKLIAQLEKFRIHYVSDRNLVNWIDDSQGFSVADPTELQNYLSHL